MYYLLQQVVYALSVGCLYALIAMGYTMVHAVIGQINLAHGPVYAIGAVAAFAAFVFAAIMGVTYAFVAAALALALVAAVTTAAAYGWATNRLIYRGLRGAGGHAPLIATIGLLVFLQEYVRIVQSDGAIWLPPVLGARFLFTGPDGFALVVTYRHILIVATTAIVLWCHHRLVARTAFGRAQRACAQDRGMAALLGIDVARTVGLTFAVGGALAGLAGFLTTLHYGVVGPYMGFVIGLKAFTAAMLGGLGSPPGAVLGGLLIGAVETFWSGYLPGDYRDVVVFGVLVAVLVFRPSGIMGQPAAEPLPGPGAARR